MRLRALLDLYSVILHIFSLTTDRLPAENLYHLTKKSASQSAHPHCAVLPKLKSGNRLPGKKQCKKPRSLTVKAVCGEFILFGETETLKPMIDTALFHDLICRKTGLDF